MIFLFLFVFFLIKEEAEEAVEEETAWIGVNG
jgi:hypothetical protein